MTLREASELLGAHTNTLRRWVDSGAIGSYRTLGGHRRLASQDVRAMAQDAPTASDGAPGGTKLDASVTNLIEGCLRGELSGTECRLRLQTLGQETAKAASDAGVGISDLLAEHAGTRKAITRLVGREPGQAVSPREPQRWAESLADAFLIGLSEGVDMIPQRASTHRFRRTQ